MTRSGKIYSERCWVNGRLQPATVCYQDGKITNIIFNKEDGATDVGRAVLMPAIIDAHVHVNEPGRTAWEGFDTATMAAAAGGIASIIDMPLNASPVTTTTAALQEKLDASAGKLHVNVGFYAGLVPGNAGELAAMAKAGVLGVKCFLTHSGIEDFPNVAATDLEEAMPIIAGLGIPLLVHCELSDDDHADALAATPVSYQAYLQSRPAKWENEAIELMIRLCKKHRCKTHIVHVSSAEALPAIASAKAAGLPLTAETCPQYLLFNAEDIPDKATIYKCAPPIRGRANNRLLKKALADKVLDFITTDHSPAPPGLKQIDTGNFAAAWGGIAGLQFLLPAAYTALKDELTLAQFIPLLTEQPALFLNLQQQKGFIQPGADADLLVWEPDASFVVAAADILHKHNISPYVNKQLFGRVQTTIVNGITVYDKNTIINKNAGKWLLKK